MADSEQITTRVGAAQVAGVTPATISDWVRHGYLAPGPWTREQVITAAQVPRTQATGTPRGMQRAGHGTATRYQGGCRCPECVEAHVQDTRAWRDRRRAARWASRQWRLFELLGSGMPYPQACAEVGATVQAVSAYRRKDEGFARRLDDALVMGRDPDLAHGASDAWRAGCRCPDCRAYHDAYR